MHRAKADDVISMAQCLLKTFKRFQGVCHSVALLSGLLVLAFYSFGEAQSTPPLLIVREAGTILYARQDVTSDRTATLEKNEKLTPLAEALGPETWYMVRTQQGIVGWVRASDVSPSNEVKDLFKADHVSTWSATASDGRRFDGTWSVEADASGDKAAGTWTLVDGAGNLIFRGTWTAEKFSTGWSGDWHASTESRQGEVRGSWTTDLPRAHEAPLAELFRAAARDAVHGIWSSADLSGSWVIRATQ